MQSLKKLLLMLLAGVVVSAAAAPAQAQSGRMSVNIPFNFVVSGHTMKAGTYQIAEQRNFVAFVNDAGRARYTLLLPDDPAAVRNGNPYLRFIRYGNESFLTGIVFSEKDTARLPRSNREKEMVARSLGVPVSVEAGGSR